MLYLVNCRIPKDLQGGDHLEGQLEGQGLNLLAIFITMAHLMEEAAEAMDGGEMSYTTVELVKEQPLEHLKIQMELYMLEEEQQVQGQVAVTVTMEELVAGEMPMQMVRVKLGIQILEVEELLGKLVVLV